MNSRIIAETAFANSLSRYVGYTTGAYHLVERLMLVIELFSDRPAIYKFEILENITPTSYKTTQKNLQEKYAIGILEFVESFGLISNIAGERSNQTNPKLVKYELSDLGRALWTAKKMQLRDYANYLIGVLLADKDADMYCLVLEYFSTERIENINKYIKSRIFELRKNRVEWINLNIRQKYLRDKIVNHVSWLKSDSNSAYIRDDGRMPDSFLRHHVTPRKSWAAEINHLDPNTKRLTDEGRKYFCRLTVNDHYSWIGPGQSTIEKLKYETIPDNGLQGPPISLLKFQELENSNSLALANQVQIDEIHNYMMHSFPYLKLISANQASIACIELYCNFIQYRDRKCFDPMITIENIIKNNSSVFATISSRKARLGYYQIRGGN